MNTKKRRVEIIAMVLAFGVSLGSCSDSNEDMGIDYTSFMQITTPIFHGDLDGQLFHWNYGIDQFQMTSGFQSPICDDSNNTLRYTVFGLMTDQTSDRVMFYSPVFDIKAPNWYEELFAEGKVELGMFEKEFSLEVLKDGQIFHTSEFTKGELRILKTEEFLDWSQRPSLRVWLTINTELTSCDCNTTIKLTNGLMIAVLLDYKKMM